MCVMKATGWRKGEKRIDHGLKYYLKLGEFTGAPGVHNNGEKLYYFGTKHLKGMPKPRRRTGPTPPPSSTSSAAATGSQWLLR